MTERVAVPELVERGDDVAEAQQVSDEGQILPCSGDRRLPDIGSVDVVLLTHDHHADNLDASGRALLPAARVVITTSPELRGSAAMPAASLTAA